MVRAKKYAGLGIMVIVAWAGTRPVEAAFFGLLGAGTVAGQTPTWRSSGNAALSRGIVSYRQGDYEAAASAFFQAQQAQQTLSPTEQQELTNWIQLNNKALQEQQGCAEALRQAEIALHDGRLQEAENLLRSVSTSQFLSPVAKQRVTDLTAQLGSKKTTTPAALAGAAAPAQLARIKLQQARALMAQRQFDAAEALARQAGQSDASFQPGEDTPNQVLHDIARQRTDPAAVLAAGRAAFNRGDLDSAARLGHQAEQAANPLTFMWKEDSPSRLLKDISEQRSRVASGQSGPTLETKHPDINGQRAAVSPPVGPEMPPASGIQQASYNEPILVPVPAPAAPVVQEVPAPATSPLALAPPRLWDTSNSPEQDRKLFEQARRAKEECEAFLTQHGQSEVTAAPVGEPSTSSPEVAAAPVGEPSTSSPEVATAPIEEPSTIGPEISSDTRVVDRRPADPRECLQMGRQLYKAGRYEEAEQMAHAAQASRGVRWGLFEDTPGKLFSDLRSARAQRDRHQSTAVLAQARQLFQKGNLEEARQQAQMAEQMHGPYKPWETGDRPQKLLAEIEVAQRDRKATPSPADQGQPLVNGPSADSGADPVKQKAVQLLAEARRLQKEGRLVEACQKAREAQKTRAVFGPQEDSPEVALAQLQGLATKRINDLLQAAGDLAAAGSADATRYGKAENNLAEARQLATGFGLDCQPIDAKLAWVQQVREKGVASTSQPTGTYPIPGEGSPQGTQPGSSVADKTGGPLSPSEGQSVAKGPDVLPPPQAATGDNIPNPLPPPEGETVAKASDPLAPAQPPPGVSKREQQGLDLLEQARMELRNGQTGNARRLAEQAYGEYGVQEQATALLRTIAGEEYNQRVLLAKRAFEAGMSLYRRMEYGQASTIFRNLDPQLLAPEQQARLRELMETPEMQPRALAQDKTKKAPDGTTAVQAKATASDAPGKAKVVSPEEDYARQVQAMADVQFQKLRFAGIDARNKATERFQHGDPDEAVQILQDYLASLRDTPLEPERIALLQRPVEARLQQFKALKAEQEIKQASVSPRDNWNREHEKQLRAEQLKQQQVTDQMKLYHTLYKEAKYREAEVAAMKALELDPDNAQAAAAVHVARMAGNVDEAQRNKENKAHIVLEGLNDTDREGPYVGDIEEPEKIDEKRFLIASKRGPGPAAIELLGNKTEREREIERQLTLPTNINFKDTPLKEVLSDLSAANNINIVPDEAALMERGISLDRPLSMTISGVQLKSALNLLLSKVHLTYVIKDEVLWITTEENAHGKMVRRVFPVADIIIPVEDHHVPGTQDLQKVIQNSAAATKLLGGAAPQPRNGLQNGAGIGTASYGQGDGGGQWAASAADPAANIRAPGQTIQDLLIDLITNTIQPGTWSKAGGPATIEYFPLGMALVVNQTPDIQEQVQELLAALRRLQDQEVAVEVRFITLDESFYERIGVDFALNVTNSQSNVAPQLITGSFAAPNQPNSFQPNNFWSGLTGISSGQSAAGAFTSDLGFPVHPGSFGPAVPPFGGYSSALPDGGLSLGLAFLSDIQVFLFLEAAQGNQRTNVMQAPKLTLFNGQTATITVQDQQYFVTNVQVVEDSGHIVFIPQNQAFPTGVQLAIQAVITGDRRFVRLSLQPTLTNLSTTTTALFPITTFITPVFDGGAQGQPIPFTQYLQQPNFSTITVETTVMVPDGGTVLLGGLKTLREGRNEFGPPLLSQLPYINRLFKNVGYGRDAQSLMLMVTPRIIIQEEEETIQTGVGTGLGLAAGAGGGQALAGGGAPVGGAGPR